MKALSLWQPWASLIALDVKRIETRGWSTKYRGPLAIHAGKSEPPRGKVGDYTPSRPRLPKTAGWELWPTARHLRRTMTPLPLGAVVATCTLVDVVPMTAHADIGDPECIVVHGDGTLDHCIPSEPPPSGPANVVRLDAPPIPGGVHLIRDISDQEPYGFFTPGRFAWLLEDITPINPVPAKGKQGLWEWEAS